MKFKHIALFLLASVPLGSVPGAVAQRTGSLVYHVRDIRRPEDFWDPASHPDGTYYYRFSAKSVYGLVKRQGVIEVLR